MFVFVQFGLTPVTMGLMFVIEGGIYALTAPIWGYLCDRKIQPKLVTLFGALLIIAGFLLIGPAPFIPVETYFCFLFISKTSFLRINF